MTEESQAHQHLEWPRLRDVVLARCQSPRAARRGLPLHDSREAAQRALDETRELMGLLQEDAAPPLSDLRDLDAHYPRLSRDGALDGSGLADVLHMLGNAARLRRYLAQHRERAPTLRADHQIDASLEDLEATLEQAVDASGELRDDASADLRRLRREVQDLKARIVGRLESLITKHRDILSDDYFTLREGRYVVPVRRDAHERFHGIVHGTSSSGASIFVEPRSIVDHGNRLKIASDEMQREAERIMAELSALIAERLPALRAAVDCIEHVDAATARARVAIELRADTPTLSEDGSVQLIAARHPLLCLDGVDVVPSDVELEAGHGLVISGPNAGGKTVVLKTVGLCALMLRAGLPIPVSPGSRMPFFEAIETELGDAQSTAMNLSTFSAHAQSLAGILSRAAPGRLVLLDELASGTDPQEGAALACGVLDALCASGATSLVTTHYEPVKALSLRDPRMRSASVGLDVETMTPTFELALDIPGVSSALTVAERFGVPHAVITYAREALPREARDFEALVQKLNAQLRSLGDARRELEAERDRLNRAAETQEAQLQAMRERGKKQLTQETERLMAELREARRALDEGRKRARQARDAEALREAEKRVNEVAARVSLGGDLNPGDDGDGGHGNGSASESGPPLPELEPGVRVFVPRLRSEAQVVEGPRRGQVRVAAGMMKLWVDVDELRGVTPGDEPKPPPRREPVEPEARRQGRAPENTLTLTGLRVDDAIGMLESFVDRLLTGHCRDGYVVHGHGTGALRSAIREHLSQHMPQVSSWRPGNHDEGGDAITVLLVD